MKSSQKGPKPGKRHRLLFYWRTMDRVWQMTLLLGVLFGCAGGFGLTKVAYIFGIHSDYWLVGVAALALAISAWAFISRFFAYVRVYPGYIYIRVPLMGLKIGFQRVRGIKPTLMQQVHPPEKQSWAQRTYLAPFYGKSVLLMELNSFPVSPTLLRLILPRAMFAPETTGLLLLVPDWMLLSTEMDSLFGAWQNTQGRARQGRLA
jgi:hypothetical protein